jgi:hypothetical protein
MRTPSPGAKLPEAKYHSYPISVGVKESWNYTSSPPYFFMA